MAGFHETMTASRMEEVEGAVGVAIMALADSLGMSTTAEGVETEKELEVIRQLGCKKIQGFFFGRPMEAEEALKLFRASRQQDSNAA